MALIKNLAARQILNSQGLPTVEAKITLENDLHFIASCPSGVSRGTKEAVELTSRDYARFHGREVSNAVKKVNEIVRMVVKGSNPVEQGMLDRKMIDLDGTPNKANMGVNSILPVSLAIAKAGAVVAKKHLFAHLNKYLNETVVEIDDFKVDVTDYAHAMPRPAMLIFEGGQHANSPQPIQEFLFLPGAENAKNLWEKLRLGSEVFHHLKQVLAEKKLFSGYGEEGGFVAPFANPSEVLDLIMASADAVGLKGGINFTLGLDIAGQKPDPACQNSAELYNFYNGLAQNYPLELLEDPFPENDWNSWTEFTKNAPPGLVVVGDDLTVTHPEVVLEALRKRAISGVVIKPNQIGTLTETLRVVKIAKSRGLKIIVSHRAGETNDDFIADLAVGVGADFIKAGGPSRGERVAKYNRLLEIDELLR